jgi:hypothetical protein
MIKKVIISILGFVVGVSILGYLTWNDMSFGATFVFVVFGICYGLVTRLYLTGKL